MAITFGPLHRFNTGRQYGVNGQPIAWATFHHDGVVGIVFSDSARDITHCVPCPFGWSSPGAGAQAIALDPTDEWVLSCYDSAMYMDDDSEVQRAFNPHHSQVQTSHDPQSEEPEGDSLDPMERLRASLGELQGVEGIEIHTMDSFLDKITGEGGAETVAVESFLGDQPDHGSNWEETIADRLTDLLELAAKHDVDVLLAMARAWGHLQAEGGMETQYLTSVMSTDGDGWEVRLQNGTTLRLLAQEGCAE